MSGNVHPNPGPIFPCSVCTGNVTWQGKSVQCCTRSKWVHLRCSQPSLSKFRTLDSFHSWSCPPPPHPNAWCSAEMEGVVSERREAFPVAHRSDEDCQAYITASQRTLSVITKAKAEAWQTICSSLSPKSNSKIVYSLLCSIAGSPSWSSFSPHFPNCSSPRLQFMPLI